MFDIFCPVEKTRVLLFTANIEMIRNMSEGIEIHYRCHCGHRGVWQTGLRQRSTLDKNLTSIASCN